MCAFVCVCKHRPLLLHPLLRHPEESQLVKWTLICKEGKPKVKVSSIGPIWLEVRMSIKERLSPNLGFPAPALLPRPIFQIKIADHNGFNLQMVGSQGIPAIPLSLSV